MEQLKGTGVAIVTPFTQKEAVDFHALGKLIDHIIHGGVNYIVALGTTGETPVLSKEEKKEIIQFAYQHVNNRVPVVIGMGGNDTRALVKDLESFPLEQAAAVLSASPYYNKPSQQGIYEHYKLVAAASPKPVILYNVPGRTGRNMTADTTINLAREVSNIIAIKEASGDLSQCMEILKEKPEGFMVMSGDDNLALAQMACGMDGVISVAANAFPAEFSQMIQHCLAHDFVKAKRLNDQLLDAYTLMFEENNPAGIKAFLKEMGIMENVLRLPLVPLSHSLQVKVKDYLAR